MLRQPQSCWSNRRGWCNCCTKRKAVGSDRRVFYDVTPNAKLLVKYISSDRSVSGLQAHSKPWLSGTLKRGPTCRSIHWEKGCRKPMLGVWVARSNPCLFRIKYCIAAQPSPAFCGHVTAFTPSLLEVFFFLFFFLLLNLLRGRSSLRLLKQRGRLVQAWMAISTSPGAHPKQVTMEMARGFVVQSLGLSGFRIPGKASWVR